MAFFGSFNKQRPSTAISKIRDTTSLSLGLTREEFIFYYNRSRKVFQDEKYSQGIDALAVDRAVFQKFKDNIYYHPLARKSCALSFIESDDGDLNTIVFNENNFADGFFTDYAVLANILGVLYKDDSADIKECWQFASDLLNFAKKVVLAQALELRTELETFGTTQTAENFLKRQFPLKDIWVLCEISFGSGKGSLILTLHKFVDSDVKQGTNPASEKVKTTDTPQVRDAENTSASDSRKYNPPAKKSTAMLVERGSRDKLGKYFDLDDALTVAIKIDGSATYDFCCFGIDANDKLSDDRYMVFYNQLRSPDREIVGEEIPSGMEFTLKLNAMPPIIQKLVFTCSIDGAGTMGEISRHEILIGDKISATFGGSDFQREKAITSLEIYRKNGQWRFNVVACGFNGGLDALLAHYGGEQAK